MSLDHQNYKFLIQAGKGGKVEGEFGYSRALFSLRIYK